MKTEHASQNLYKSLQGGRRPGRFASFAGCLLLILGSNLALAAEKITLTAIDAYAPTSSWTRVFIDYYIPEVDRRLALTGNYEIKWIKAFSGTVAKHKGVLDALKYGIGDIGIVTTPFHPDKVPFYNLSYATPFVTSDADLVGKAMTDLADRYPSVKNEWKKYNQVSLATLGNIDNYQVFMSRPIKSLDDFKGTKIAGVGINLRYVGGVGAVAVGSNLADYYNNIDTGLVDGAVIWSEAATAYKIYEVAQSYVDIGIGATNSKVVNVNTRTWERLPEEVKQVLASTAVDYRDALAKDVIEKGIKARQEYVENGGNIVTLTEEQRSYWANSLPNLAREWVEDMEARGFPGEAILKDYMDIMRANNQPILRQWDRE